MKTLLTTIALILLALAAHAQSTDSIRAVPPQKIRVIQSQPVPVEPAQAMSADAPSPCTELRTEYAGMCWDKTPTFNNYFSMAGYCGASGGRLPTIGELAGFTAYFGVSGIECSSDFDSGTLWCASSTGVSGKDLSQQVKSLYELKSLFRCVRPLPR